MGRFEWKDEMTELEQKNMVDFILYLYEGYQRWCHHPGREDLDDRHIHYLLYEAGREVTRIIGEFKNIRISKEARSLLNIVDEETTFSGYLSSRKAHPDKTVREHYKPADDFIKQFKQFADENKPFGKKEAIAWLEEAIIAIITSDEDKTLTELGYVRNRPNPAEAYDEAGIVATPFIPARIKKTKK